MNTQQRWIHTTKARYYQVELIRDLFGDWTLVQCWGGLGSRRGGMRMVWVPSYDAGWKQVERIGKRRITRGYQAVNEAT
jgi:hypothetical protein